MPYSHISSRGQTTIPRAIRKLLKLKPKDTIVYVVQGDKVYLEPITGNIFDLYGVIKVTHGPIDFKKLREQFETDMAHRAMKDLQ